MSMTLASCARKIIVVTALATVVLASGCSGQSTSEQQKSSAYNDQITTQANASDATSSSALPGTMESDGRIDGKLRLQLNWIPAPEHSPYFVASANGWYHGLDVDIMPGSGSGAAATNVGTGRVDCGVADAPVVINAIRNGAKLVIVAMVFDLGAADIWALKSSGIRTPADLAGKTVAVMPGDVYNVLFPALAKANDISEGDVDFVEVGNTGKYAALASGNVDAIMDATTAKPFVDEAVGIDNVVELHWSDFGVDLYGQSIFCYAPFVQEHSDWVKAFLDGAYRAWNTVIQDPRSAIEVEKTFDPTIDVDQYLEGFKVGLGMMCTERYRDHGIGWIDEQKMQSTVDLIQELMSADSDIESASEVYRGDLLPRHDFPVRACETFATS